MYKIKTNYLEHDGGTKFYETVLITQNNGQSMVIKRYGAVANKMGGGTTIIEAGSAKAAVSRDKILREKRAERPGKGRYVDAPGPNFGLFLASGQTINRNSLVAGVKRHYARKDFDEILNYFTTESSTSDPASAWVPTPEVPVIRDETWGSW